MDGPFSFHRVNRLIHPQPVANREKDLYTPVGIATDAGRECSFRIDPFARCT
jgi:hypothetical protein